MKSSNKVYIAIGSNLKKPIKQVQKAIEIMNLSTAIHISKTAKIYKSKPYGVTNQPDFINTVIEANTELTPYELLSYLQNIEKQLGRTKEKHWGPRIIDLDIVSYNDLVINEENLKIPHPLAYDREFVIIPLNDINPQLSIKTQGVVSELAKKFSNHNMQVVDFDEFL